MSFRFKTRQSVLAWRPRFIRIATLVALAMSLVCPAVSGQQKQDVPQRTQQSGQPRQVFASAPLSSLAQQNLDYVAASAPDIERVLEEQPGLLVELQHWVARDAADHGQMVDEQQMSKDGIYARLGNDLKFRAVATRLLQSYGYLTPEVNPNSKMGREQQLQLAAEQKRIDQMPTQQVPPAGSAPQDQSYLAYQQAPPGNSRGQQLWQNQEQLAPQQWGPVIRPPQNQPNLTNPGDQLLNMRQVNQTLDPQSVPDSLGTMGTTLPLGSMDEANTESQGSLGGLAGLGGMDSSSGYGLDADSLSSGASYPSFSTLQQPGGNFGRTQMGPGFSQPMTMMQPTAPGSRTLSRPWRYSPYYQQTGQSYQQEYPRPQVVHRANPYSDIPSLYDLYEQVSPHSPKLARFGLDVFANAPPDQTGELPMDLPAGPSYVVGPGDGLSINVWGSMAARVYRVVDREGRVSLPEVGPLMVSGESMSAVQQRVQQALRTQFRDVSADVSLVRLRTVRVYVVGEVIYPGAYDISSLSTPLNALMAAGGPVKEGSLRMVKHYRGKDLVQTVDLYDLLLRGVRSDLERLEDGDTILVPPVGPEVTVEGTVRRPAVYELHGEGTLAQVLQLAGGILPTAALRHIEVQRVEAHEKRTMLSLNIQNPKGSDDINQQLESFDIHDGDVVRIFPIAPYNEDAVYLEGHVLRPGRYSFHAGMRLSDLVASYSDLLPEPATHYAEIIRLKAPDYSPTVESFDLSEALSHPQSSPKLEPLDTVRIFSRFDFNFAPTVTVGGDVRNPGTFRTSGVVHVRDAIYQAGGVSPDAFLGSAQLVRNLPDGKLNIMSINLQEALNGNPKANVLLESRDRIMVQQNPLKADPPSVYVEGDVVRPGRFPLTANLRISDLVGLAGGLKRSADRRTADLTRYDAGNSGAGAGAHQEINLEAALRGTGGPDPVLKDGDLLTIKQIAGWKDIGSSITISGEVKHPGTYGISPGERLSSVLERAGGFLPTAYPTAAVLERSSVRQLQEKSRNELIQQVEQSATNVKVSINSTASEAAALQSAALQQQQQVLAALKNAPITGRLVIHLRTDLSAFANSQDDIQVQAGDTLMIPKRPDFVIVTGQVYNSNAITYEPDRTAGWYLRRAGGVTALGNKGAIFVVRSDGSVVSGSGNGWWRGDVLSARVGPGDTIVVPEKPIGGSLFWKNLIQISQVASSTAIVAALIP
ncbi:MAG TPA: SLBB domain-containing protein [Terriglobia bacterium]|nr:SLBB domain-containing protein [Terriglobia bacterium]